MLDWIDRLVGDVSSNPWWALLVGVAIGIVIGAAITSSARPMR